jgi:hypothetical protein
MVEISFAHAVPETCRKSWKILISRRLPGPQGRLTFEARGYVMRKIFSGRYTARLEGSFVVFFIGMRVNRLLAFRKWMRVARAMPPMLRELHTQDEFGFLGMEAFFYWRGVATLQYWKSFDHLHNYAHGARHLPAWTEYNRAVGNDGTVGIWHETYLVEPHHSENIYANMPRWGFGNAAEHIAVTGVRDTARQRINADGGSAT